ncbi:MAG TPA: hypothetical protein ENF47_03035 [Thermoprotei archaeon]|nr:hypothetical protein [Thermoprotei archaeon]
MEDIGRIVEKLENYRIVTNRMLSLLNKIHDFIVAIMRDANIEEVETDKLIVRRSTYSAYDLRFTVKSLAESGYLPSDTQRLSYEGYWAGDFNKPFRNLSREGVLEVAKNIDGVFIKLVEEVDRYTKDASEQVKKLQKIVEVIRST